MRIARHHHRKEVEKETWAREAKAQKEVAREKDLAKGPSTGAGSAAGSTMLPVVRKEKERASWDGLKDPRIGAQKNQKKDP